VDAVAENSEGSAMVKLAAERPKLLKPAVFNSEIIAEAKLDLKVAVAEALAVASVI